MLGKLHLTSSHPNPELLRTVLELTAEAIETKIAMDATSRNALTKLQTVLLKIVHDSATAERGGDETALEETVMTATLAHRRHTQAKNSDEDEEDEVTMQLRREMEESVLEDPEAESTHINAIGDETVGGATADGIDVSQLPDEKEMQSLVDSFEDEDDDDLLE